MYQYTSLKKTKKIKKNTLDKFLKKLMRVMENTNKTRLHKSRSSRDKLEFDLSNFV